MKVIPQACRVH